MRRGVIFLLLAGVVFCWLGILLPLPVTTTASEVPEVLEVPSVLGGVSAGHVDVDRGTNAPAPVPEGSYPPALLAEEAQEADKLPVNALLLTMVVLVIASFGASFLWLLTTTNARHRRGAICSFLGVLRGSLGAGWEEEQSFLGVFVL
jgi:hypothetical protein